MLRTRLFLSTCGPTGGVAFAALLDEDTSRLIAKERSVGMGGGVLAGEYEPLVTLGFSARVS